jgi:acyl-CoA hydrolase
MADQILPQIYSGKPVSTSKISITQLMQPEHVSLMGNVHGGWIMKLVDEAGRARKEYCLEQSRKAK